MSGVSRVFLCSPDWSQARHVDQVSLPLPPESEIKGMHPHIPLDLIMKVYFCMYGYLPAYVSVLQVCACCHQRPELVGSCSCGCCCHCSAGGVLLNLEFCNWAGCVASGPYRPPTSAPQCELHVGHNACLLSRLRHLKGGSSVLWPAPYPVSPQSPDLPCWGHPVSSPLYCCLLAPPLGTHTVLAYGWFLCQRGLILQDVWPFPLGPQEPEQAL